ncbi:ABC transporter substrate-binding protein [Aurantimonas sp. VKM B-3413]|uniref:ABC transporter substrate-binding protein n=1 Tax=Aurantimonas sp. VKM B-3413 TaxID=2779401 RepID=UPI001E2EB89B|nr:ABC transporter substrate-binding protein [Aurantimonas sp. VKM B-3413]MCB8837008.1 ABC transporter substrate-binding protein [Aurantimonas sp. VKM B-3413]
MNKFREKTMGMFEYKQGLMAFSAALSGAAMLVSTCIAGAQEQTTINFMMNSPAAGYNSGFELAKVRGYYEAEGLNVNIEPGNGSAVAAQLVAAGRYDIAFADAAAVMNLVKDGAPITIVATILQSSPNQITFLADSGATKPTDMKGKRVAIPNGYSQAAMFPLVLDHIGLTEDDINLINMPAESMVASLLQGQVDVILGSIDNFGVLLKKQGAKTVDFLYSDYGAPAVSTGVIVRTPYLQENPDVVRAFLRASLKGWSDAIDDNEAALAAMSEVFPDANRELAPGQLDATEVLMCSNGAHFVGKATQEAWTGTIKTLSAIGILPSDKPASEYYSYEYLPEESKLRKCPLGAAG